MADCCASGGGFERVDSHSVIELEEICQKKPKRILHFSDGILEEYEEEEKIDDRVDKCQVVVNPSTLSWLPFVWYYAITFGTKTLHVCDSVGESLAYFFGITSPKYQYEIEEYKWMKQQEEKLAKEKEEEMKSWGASDVESDGKESNEQLSAIASQPSVERQSTDSEELLL